MKTIEKDPVKGSDINKPAVIGTFEGKCADGRVTNENGLDITDEVWTTLFASEDFKRGIKYGWYLGRLGHPEDVGDEHYVDTCIVMTEGHIDENRELWGKFDLIDTPTGRVVKTLIDAGVTFGISVRGAGDIVANSVDPETFVFRGFDLVAFPAYKDAIPTFQEIAASSDLDKQKTWKKVCASIRSNLSGINSCDTLDAIQSELPQNSDVYQEIEERKAEINEPEVEECSIDKQRADGLLKLYLESQDTIRELRNRLGSVTDELNSIMNGGNIQASRRIKASQRIYKDQMDLLLAKNDELSKKYKTVVTANTHLKKENRRIISSRAEEATKHEKILASTISDLKDKVTSLEEDLRNERTSNKRLKEKNLSLSQKVTSSRSEADEKDSIIASLRDEIAETVSASKSLEQRASNRDEKVNELQKDVDDVLAIVAEYQDAYAHLYATCIGKDLDDIEVGSTTRVDELRKLVSGTNTSGISARPSVSDLEMGGDDRLVTA